MYFFFFLKSMLHGSKLSAMFIIRFEGSCKVKEAACGFVTGKAPGAVREGSSTIQVL